MKEAQARGVVIDLGHGGAALLQGSRKGARERRPAGYGQHRHQQLHHRGAGLRFRHHTHQAHAPGHASGGGREAFHRDPGSCAGLGRHARRPEGGSGGRRYVMREEEGCSRWSTGSAR